MVRLAIVSFTAVVTLSPPASAVVVFDNTTSYTGLTNVLMDQMQMNSTEHGSPLTLDVSPGQRLYAVDMQ